MNIQSSHFKHIIFGIIFSLTAGWYIHEFGHALVGNILGTARLVSYNLTTYRGDYPAIVVLSGPVFSVSLYALIARKYFYFGVSATIVELILNQRSSDWTIFEEVTGFSGMVAFMLLVYSLMVIYYFIGRRHGHSANRKVSKQTKRSKRPLHRSNGRGVSVRVPSTGTILQRRSW